MEKIPNHCVDARWMHAETHKLYPKSNVSGSLPHDVIAQSPLISYQLSASLACWYWSTQELDVCIFNMNGARWKKMEMITIIVSKVLSGLRQIASLDHLLFKMTDGWFVLIRNSSSGTTKVCYRLASVFAIAEKLWWHELKIKDKRNGHLK